MHTQLYAFGAFRLHTHERQLRPAAHLVQQLLLRESHQELPSALEPSDTLRQFIQQVVDQLPPAEQEIVGAASVAGIEFCVSSVAAALNRSGPDVEMQCVAMAQAGRFFATCGWSELSDGTGRQRYRFLHSLVREVIYERLPARRRTRWHLRIGECLERAVAGQKVQAEAELAQHFRMGRDAQRAIHYFKEAAQRCLERSAATDAVLHIKRALELLRHIPELKERKRLVLELRRQYRKAQELM